MKLVQINVTNFGSTGKIMRGIKSVAEKNDIECITFALKPQKASKVKREDGVCFFSNFYEYALHYYMSKFTGSERLGSYFGTARLIKRIKKYNPDVIHLHNIHGRYINIPLLFRYLKKSKKKIVWTLHDCWAFTGHCPHFVYQNCYKWKTGCDNCPRFKEYPETVFDDSKKMYKLKRKWFSGIENLTLVTPSKWLAELTKESFLKNYPVKVINNGIDLNTFKPTESDFKEKYNCEDKFLILGVAFKWGDKKGLDIFTSLSKRLDDRFQIVLVGTDEKTDLKLPENIISIHRTNNQKELAEIYTAADLFVIPTREENFPTVNLESLACGTPVLTFNTGGSPECINSTCGAVTRSNDLQSIEEEIIRIYNEKPFTEENCIQFSKSFKDEDKYYEYINLYDTI